MTRGLAVVVLLPAALAAQQRTLVVDQLAGPFFDLSPAVAASRPGDRIEIRRGAYSATTVTHGLDLDAPSGAVVTSLTVSGLAAHHAVRIHRLDPSTGLVIQSCVGPVHVDRVVAGPSQVSDSRAVAFSDCAIDLSLVATGATALFVTRGTVVATRSTFIGAIGGLGAGPLSSAQRGADGIAMLDARIVLIDCVVRGGRGEARTGCSAAHSALVMEAMV